MRREATRLCQGYDGACPQDLREVSTVWRGTAPADSSSSSVAGKGPRTFCVIQSATPRSTQSRGPDALASRRRSFARAAGALLPSRLAAPGRKSKKRAAEAAARPRGRGRTPPPGQERLGGAAPRHPSPGPSARRTLLLSRSCRRFLLFAAITRSQRLRFRSTFLCGRSGASGLLPPSPRDRPISGGAGLGWAGPGPAATRSAPRPAAPTEHHAAPPARPALEPTAEGSIRSRRRASQATAASPSDSADEQPPPAPPPAIGASLLSGPGPGRGGPRAGEGGPEAGPGTEEAGRGRHRVGVPGGVAGAPG